MKNSFIYSSPLTNLTQKSTQTNSFITIRVPSTRTKSRDKNSQQNKLNCKRKSNIRISSVPFKQLILPKNQANENVYFPFSMMTIKIYRE